jgi:hypothetical protein
MAVIACIHCGAEFEVADPASIRTGHEASPRQPRQWVISIGKTTVHRCGDMADPRANYDVEE